MRSYNLLKNLQKLVITKIIVSLRRSSKQTGAKFGFFVFVFSFYNLTNVIPIQCNSYPILKAPKNCERAYFILKVIF